MSDAVIIGLCASIPATITAAAAFVVAWRTGRKVDVVEKQTNSMHDKLMKGAYKQGGDDERANPSVPE